MPLFGHREAISRDLGSEERRQPGREASRDAHDARVAREARELERDLRDARALAAALRDAGDPWAQRQAATALERIGDAEAVAALLAALEDGDAPARSCAAVALGHVGDPAAVGPLVRTLRDEKWSVRRDAAEALGALRDERAVDALGALADDQRLVRQPAVEALLRIGGARVVEPLAVFLGDRDEDIRGRAVRALAEVGGPQAAEHIGGALRDESAYIREMAAEALGELGDARSIEPLIALATDPSRPADGVLRALTEIARPSRDRRRVLETLMAALGAPSAERRAEAAACLDELGWVPDGEPAAAAYFAAKAEWARCVALGRPAVNALILSIGEWGGEEAVARALAALAPSPRPFLEMLADPAVPESARLGAIGVVAALGDPDDAVALEPLVADASPDVRVAAIRALGHVAPAVAVERFGEALHDPEPDVRLTAAEALGQAGGPRAVELLEAAARGEPVEWLRQWIATQLENAARALDEAAAAGGETDLAVLADLCMAYAEGDGIAAMRLEPIAVEIGRRLHRQGGLGAMWLACEQLGDVAGIESLEKLWSGVREARA